MNDGKWKNCTERRRWRVKERLGHRNKKTEFKGKTEARNQ